jgi:hypothetical protein
MMRGMARIFEPSIVPNPISETSRIALTALMPTSGPAAARPTNAAPAISVSPHWRRSFRNGSAIRSAPQCAAQTAVTKINPQNHVCIQGNIPSQSVNYCALPRAR